ncbi:MAG: hypothetical protein M3460_02760 [Actinomycetota bacterium]|nr:hypothetical protein [Actinomycetota bacterium]
MGSALVFLAVHRALIDDAYITIDYARTLAQHGQWALEPGHQSNTATSPLNVLLLAGLIVLSGAPVVSVGILLIASLAVTGAALSVICARLGWSHWLAAIAVSLLAVNPLLISTIGLETYLGIALIAALGSAVIARRPVATGVVCGLLVLTRADLAAFALAALIAVIGNSPARTRVRRVAHVVGVTGLVALPWFVASWWWLGSAVPDTLLLKVNEMWVDRSFANGLWYFWLGYPLAVDLSMLPAAFGLIALAVWGVVAARRLGGPGAVLAIVWGIGAVLHVTVYLLLKVPPYQWYYGPAVGALSMLGALSVGGLSRRFQCAVSPIGVLLIAVTAVFLAVRPWTLTTISGNWASASEYAALAARVPPGTTVRTFGEVGTVAYFCDCTVVDRFSDRAQVADLLRARRAEAGPVLRTLLDWNYHRFKAGPPIHPVYEFAFAEDPTGVHVTSWRAYAGQMVVRPAR